MSLPFLLPTPAHPLACLNTCLVFFLNHEWVASLALPAHPLAHSHDLWAWLVEQVGRAASATCLLARLLTLVVLEWIGKWLAG